MYKKIVKYMAYLRDKRRSKDSNLRWKLERKTEELEGLVHLRLELVKSLMQHYGIEKLPADEKEREQLLKKYPNLHDIYNKLYDAAHEAGRITIGNPWLWKPGEDAGNYYDIGAVQDRMVAIANSEEEYSEYLHNRIKELEAQIKDSPDNQDLINEQNYKMALLEDMLATIGDKMIEMWWNAIPRIIKEKYARYMDDLMISALGSNDLLAGIVKAYDKLQNDEKEEISVAFVTVLIKDLNETVFKDSPINLQVYSSHDDAVGGFNLTYEKDEAVGFNVANIGKNIDEVVGTLKHEILGHYIDKHYTNIGLQGDAMRKFVSEQLVNNNDEIFCHGHIYTEPELIVISPLLKQRYQLEELNELEEDKLKEVANTLYQDGWKLACYYGGERDTYYKNIMTERSAWLIDKQTKDVVRKIDAYRAARGLPRIGSVQIEKRSIER